LGVCLGHQCIIEAFDGKVARATETIHGKYSKILHDGKTIFTGIQNPFHAARYHSLAGLEIPYSLEISARTQNNIIMAVRHKEYFVEGVQFHPESILTPSGGNIIENIINRVGK
jgi:para-aminobenzoate synthetase component 2